MVLLHLSQPLFPLCEVQELMANPSSNAEESVRQCSVLKQAQHRAGPEEVLHEWQVLFPPSVLICKRT